MEDNLIFEGDKMDLVRYPEGKKTVLSSYVTYKANTYYVTFMLERINGGQIKIHIKDIQMPKNTNEDTLSKKVLIQKIKEHFADKNKIQRDFNTQMEEFDQMHDKNEILEESYRMIKDLTSRIGEYTDNYSFVEECLWEYDGFDCAYATSCGNLHQFMAGTPHDNDYKYCPYCGKKIKTV